jgi:glucuronokinase
VGGDFCSRPAANPLPDWWAIPPTGTSARRSPFAFSNFHAEVVLYETPELEILPSEKDRSCFTSIQALVQGRALHGYYGGIRLLKATVKRFYDYCQDNQIDLHDKNFTIRYDSDIPTASAWPAPAPSSPRACGR